MSSKRIARLLIPVLTVVLGMTVTGCGAKNNAESEKAAANTPAAEEAEAEGRTPAVLDDDTAKIVLTGLFKISPDEKDMGEEDLKAGVSFEVTNKSDKEIIVDVRGLKVGTQDVSRKLLEGDVVEPGTTQIFRYGILEPEAEDGAEAKDAGAGLSWTAVTEQGLSGTIQVLDLSGELAAAEFTAAE